MNQVFNFTFATLLAIFSISSGFSQHPILYDDLVFHSNFEKEVFKTTENPSPKQVLSLILAISPEINKSNEKEAENFILQICKELEEKGIRSKKIKKASKILFDGVHKHMTKYEENVQFDVLYQKGVYNCVTATALYAFILDNFNIPYQIKKYPTHVNLVIDPNGENILVETTNPIDGISIADKENIVQYLQENKLVSQQETTGLTTDQIYDAYYKINITNISLSELPAILYWNKVIAIIEKEDYTLARQLIEKSIFLKYEEAKEVSRMMVLAHLSDRVTSEKPENFEPMFELLNYEKMSQFVETQILDNFNILAREKLIGKFDSAGFENFYKYFAENSKNNKDLSNDLEFNYHLFWAVNLEARGEKRAAYKHLEAAYILETENLAIQLFISELAGIFYEEAKGESLENNELYWLEKFPFLEKQEYFNEVMLLKKCIKLCAFFEKDQETDGFKIYKNIEPLLKKSNNERIIAHVYGQIFHHFIRWEDYESAQKWIEKGLEISPENMALNDCKKRLEEFLQDQDSDSPKISNKKKNQN
jgi:hypothetical protein